MKNKIILAVLIFLAIISLTAFIRLKGENYQSAGNGNILPGQNNNSNSNNTNSQNGISQAVLAEHNTKTNCWVAYNGKVYDITSWLPVHPGGANAIAPYCGTSTEFTNAFTQKHGTSKVNKLMQVGTLIGDFDIKGELN